MNTIVAVFYQVKQFVFGPDSHAMKPSKISGIQHADRTIRLCQKFAFVLFSDFNTLACHYFAIAVGIQLT